jgi:hypothetical protein
MDSGTVRVGGAERAWAASLCTDMMEGVLALDHFPSFKDAPLSTLLRMLKPGHYVHDIIKTGDPHRVAKALQTSLSVELGGHMLEWNGQPVEVFAIALNTALALGSDAVRFSARMHGSCEIHAWVDGRNRWWISDIIEEGLASGVTRSATDALRELARHHRDAAQVIAEPCSHVLQRYRLVSELRIGVWSRLRGDALEQDERSRTETDGGQAECVRRTA